MESVWQMLPLRDNNLKTKKRPEVGTVENLEGHKDAKTKVKAVADMPAVCLLGRARENLGESRLQRAAPGDDNNGLQDCWKAHLNSQGAVHLRLKLKKK